MSPQKTQTLSLIAVLLFTGILLFGDRVFAKNETLEKIGNKESVKPEHLNRIKGDLAVSGTNTFRVENWETFKLGGSTLDNDYRFSADRLSLKLKFDDDWGSINANVTGVKFAGLPKTGSAGIGPLYFSQNGNDSNHSEVYLRALNAVFKRIGDKGMSGTIGRFDFSGGTEFKGKNQKIEWLKMNRIGERVLGPFNWSFYQRSMNGVLLNRDNGRLFISTSTWFPTAGGFSKGAGDVMEDIRVFTLAGTFKYDAFVRNQELQLFFYNYDDDRNVVAPRPDNTKKVSTGGIDVSVKNFGFYLAGTYERAKTAIDTLFWFIHQRGDWFELAHKADAWAIESGLQWKKAKWNPWLRIGWNKSTGDDNPSDGKHSTFFQMLPTARQYSLSTIYNLMNTSDVFAQLFLKPHNRLNVRGDFHSLKLSESNDRWYFGSGATQDSGNVNGFGARATGGSEKLGNILELQSSYTFNKMLSMTVYLSKFNGSTVSKSVFPGHSDQIFNYFEMVYNF